MNYYNPYFSMGPSIMAAPATQAVGRGLFSGLAGRGLSLSSIINGTQKTLGLINQAIPVIKQVSPVVKNAKTMFRVMNEFKKVDTPVTDKSSQEQVQSTSSNENTSIDSTKQTYTSTVTDTNAPTFFI